MRRFLLLLLAGQAAGFGAESGAELSGGDRLANIAELNARTQWVGQPKPGSLPAGVSHQTFFSRALGQDVGYCIYLPPGYDHAVRRYPVIYNLNGGGENELHGLADARILNEGIISGRWPPMILVLANGGAATLFEDSADGKYPGETLIIRELIPHVDATYRTIASRNGRAIEGFSMGGRGAVSLALKYPELFCSLHNQSGKVLHVADLYDPSKPNQYPNNYLGPDRARYEDDDVFLLIRKNAAAIKSGLRIEMTCGTKDAVHIRSVRELHAALLAAGIDHTYVELEGVAHDHGTILRRYGPIWFDYHAESFSRR